MPVVLLTFFVFLAWTRYQVMNPQLPGMTKLFVVVIFPETDAYDLADQRLEIFARKTNRAWIGIHTLPEDLE